MNYTKQTSDENTVTQIISENKTLVEAIAMKFINSPLERDDLIQEGMIGLLAAIYSFDKQKGVSFTTYASHCVKNSIITALKKISRVKDIPQDAIVSIDDTAFGDDMTYFSAEDEYIAKENVNNLNKSLYEDLSSFENEVLRLHIMGCSYNEIAIKLDRNPKAIDNAIQRIRKKLQDVSFEYYNA